MGKIDIMSKPKIRQNTITTANKARLMLYLVISLVLISFDQYTKWLIIQSLEFGSSIEVTPFFNIVYVLNTGAAFGVLSSQSGWQLYFLSLVAIIASGFIVYLMRQAQRNHLEIIGLSCILAGAIGNLIDRLIMGAVIDFLDFHLFGWHFPAFNIADTCITIGAILVILNEFFLYRHRIEEKQAK